MDLQQWLQGSESERSAWRAGARENIPSATASHGTWIGEAAPESATAMTGPLSGVGFAVKDNIDVAGLPTTAGSPLLNSVARADAGVVNSLRDSGAVVLGKTNMHELAFGITSNNPTYGPVRNPFDPQRIAGGSSGGSAVSVATGAVPFALGTDTGGSITIPAAFCGVVGFRPTTGRYPGDGLVNLSHSRDTVGVHACTATDVALVDAVVTHRPAGAAASPVDVAGLRIGIPTGRFDDLDPEVSRCVKNGLDALTAAGATLVEVTVADDLALGGGPGITLVLYEAARLLRRYLAETDRPEHPTLEEIADRVASPDVRALVMLMATESTTAEDYEQARRVRWTLQRSYARAFADSGAQVFVWPTTPVLAPLVGQDDTLTLNGREVAVFPTVTRFAAPGTVAGQPMVTLPCGASKIGVPVGLCLEGRSRDDERLLAIAAALQPVLGDAHSTL